MTTAFEKKRELVKELRRWYGDLGPMDNWTIDQIENLLASARSHQRFVSSTNGLIDAIESRIKNL